MLGRVARWAEEEAGMDVGIACLVAAVGLSRALRD